MKGAIEALERIDDAAVDLASLCHELGVQARSASRQLANVRGAIKNEWLTRSARALIERQD